MHEGSLALLVNNSGISTHTLLQYLFCVYIQYIDKKDLEESTDNTYTAPIDKSRLAIVESVIQVNARTPTLIQNNTNQFAIDRVP